MNRLVLFVLGLALCANSLSAELDVMRAARMAGRQVSTIFNPKQKVVAEINGKYIKISPQTSCAPLNNKGWSRWSACQCCLVKDLYRSDRWRSGKTEKMNTKAAEAWNKDCEKYCPGNENSLEDGNDRGNENSLEDGNDRGNEDSLADGNNLRERFQQLFKNILKTPEVILSKEVTSKRVLEDGDIKNILQTAADEGAFSLENFKIGDYTLKNFADKGGAKTGILYGLFKGGKLVYVLKETIANTTESRNLLDVSAVITTHGGNLLGGRFKIMDIKGLFRFKSGGIYHYMILLDGAAGAELKKLTNCFATLFSSQASTVFEDSNRQPQWDTNAHEQSIQSAIFQNKNISSDFKKSIKNLMNGFYDLGKGLGQMHQSNLVQKKLKEGSFYSKMVHGDFHMGNIMISFDEHKNPIVNVIDSESLADSLESGTSILDDVFAGIYGRATVSTSRYTLPDSISQLFWHKTILYKFFMGYIQSYPPQQQKPLYDYLRRKLLQEIGLRWGKLWVFNQIGFKALRNGLLKNMLNTISMALFKEVRDKSIRHEERKVTESMKK